MSWSEVLSNKEEEFIGKTIERHNNLASSASMFLYGIIKLRTRVLGSRVHGIILESR